MTSSPRTRPLSLAFCALGAALLTAHPARGDAPPGGGLRFVGFTFTIEGLAKHPERELVAFPCSASNGAPMRRAVPIRDGEPVQVGRRGGPCKLYAIAKQEHDAVRAASWKPAGPFDADAYAKAIEGLVEAGKLPACNLSPNINHVVPAADPRKAVTDALTVVALDETRCELQRPAAEAASAAGASGDPPKRPGESVRRAGCAGCAVGGEGTSSPGATWAALAAAWLMAARIRSTRVFRLAPRQRGGLRARCSNQQP